MITVNILVMDGDWPNEVRSIVISNIYKCLTSILEVEEPSPNWWVSFQVIEDGSWGSRGGVLSILDLVESGVFTDEKIKAIRKNMLPEQDILKLKTPPVNLYIFRYRCFILRCFDMGLRSLALDSHLFNQT
ncbi:hypothetical protein [Paenibacillus sp. JJ-223]|uniref:hypothetical protein n=1 Tax=Paenibacillus sp. JJ-223 TaxID=2905647 RepID=UPI001F44DD1E|nr:hypothetical protein [Paenibacillus sp. JJ-223]